MQALPPLCLQLPGAGSPLLPGLRRALGAAEMTGQQVDLIRNDN